MKFRNYKGEYVEAKPLLEEIIFSLVDSFIVISTNATHSRFDVRYGLQHRTFDNFDDALAEYTNCLRHYYECEVFLA